MIIAIATDEGRVSTHFGRCLAYTLVNIEDGNVKAKDVVANPGHSMGTIPKFLWEKGAKRIVCGGMGHKALELFSQYGIEITTGVEGTIDTVIGQLTQGTLVGGQSACTPGAGRGYGIEKTECDHTHEDHR